MDTRDLAKVLELGENSSCEFKRCGNQPHADVFESVCAFANSFGGALYLGVEDNGTVCGLPRQSLLPIKRNIVNVVNNPNVFDPPAAVEFEDIETNGKWIIRLWVPSSASIHSFKGKVYERIEDADVIVRTGSQLAELSIRKQNVFTEQQVFKYVKLDDLKLDVLAQARERAAIHRTGHPWSALGDEQLLRSAGLFGRNYATNEEGFNLAAVLLLGKDEVIRSVCPPYGTDALVRINDTRRYDDRLEVRCNLVEAYEQLSGFCRRNMPDPFYLSGDTNISPRDVIVRELVVNCLVHREFTSMFPARITIDAAGIRTENASKAPFRGTLSPSRLNPIPKNPLIASFFTQIGLAEKLGSGTRNLFEYSRIYSGKNPVLEEGPVFKAFVPIPVFDNAEEPQTEGTERADTKSPDSATVQPETPTGPLDLKRSIAAIFDATAGGKAISVSDLVETGVSRRTAQRGLRKLVEDGFLVAEGQGRSRRYRRAE